MNELIQQYGYYAVYIATIFEGELSLIVAGYLAHESLLNFWILVVLGTLGAVTGDNFSFYVAKKKGRQLLTRTPRIEARADALSSHLRITSPFMQFSSHFFIGFRSLLAIMIAINGVKQRHFLVLNLAGSFVWALIITSLGYFFGYQLEQFLGSLTLFKGALLAVAVMVALLALIRGIEALWLRS